MNKKNKVEAIRVCNEILKLNDKLQMLKKQSFNTKNKK